MGKAWDDFSTAKPGQNNGGFFNHSGNGRLGVNTAKYDRQAFIAFLREVMTEALRVLKPGGHALVWALPRTSYWTATALEDAGFEVRDAIFHHFGSGFPKSTAIDKQIDKMLGKEREVIGPSPNWRPAKTHGGAGFDKLGNGPATIDITAPATPEAAQWAGYGTSLKPSTEIWWLVRKPLAESSIAANVLTWNCGALNIDACRVGTTENLQRPFGTPSDHIGQLKNLPKGELNPASPLGRWPSHLLLSHSIWCVPQGVKRVRGTAPRGKPSEGQAIQASVTWSLGVHKNTDYADPEGYEQVEAYQCHESCPIAELDRQSGVRKGATSNSYSGHDARVAYGDKWGAIEKHPGYNDQGGASRYFQQFPPDDYTPFGYFSKASRAERNAGCEGLPFHTPGECTDRKEGSAGLNNPRAGAGRTGGGFNVHPTVKSTSLMRWLIRLITPPGGVVLDMFGGSGSTAVAAIQEGKHFILIEQDTSYVAICEARIAHATEEAQLTQAKRELGWLVPGPKQEYDEEVPA